MTSRISFAASSAVLASLLVLASACNDTVDLDVGKQNGDGGTDGNGGDGGDGEGGTGADGAVAPNGDCPSNLRVENVCQPEVPVASVAADCTSGVADGQCKPAALKAGTLSDCGPTGITDAVCELAPPLLASWVCPAGSTALPGVRAANGSPLTVEGVSNFTSCQAVWADGACANGTSPRFGSASCQAISPRACPGAGTWPSDAVIQASVGAGATPIIFVSPTGAATGDGLDRTLPVNLATGLAAAAATGGVIVALAQGSYTSDQISLDRDIAVVGACAAQTQISVANRDENNALFLLGASGARVAELTISGDRPGVTATSDGTHIDNVQILNALTAGVSVTGGGRLTVNNLLVSGTRKTLAQTGGSGLAVSGASSANLAGVALVGNRGAAIDVSATNSDVTGTDVIVTDTVAGSAQAGLGASVSAGGNLDLTRAVFASTRDAGVLVDGAASTVSLVDTFITGTVSASAGTLSGAALYASGGAGVSAQRLLATGNVLGLRAAGADTTLVVEDSIIADPSAPGANANAGAGVLGEGGPTLTLRQLVLLRTRAGVITQAGELRLENAVITGSTAAPLTATGTDARLLQTTFANNAGGLSFVGGRLDVQDTRVVDTQAVGSSETHAVFVNGADGTMERLVLARTPEYGLFVTGAKANLDISDLRVTDTRSVQNAGKAVRGIGVAIADTMDPSGPPPVVNLTRGIIAQSHEHGVSVTGPSPQVSLSDVSVVGTLAADLPVRSGAISFVNSAPLTQPADGLLSLVRTKIDDNADSGASVSGLGIELDLLDVSISNTHALATGEAGAGLSAQNGSVLSGTRVQLTNNAGTGVQVQDTGTKLDLTDLVVSDTQPGSGSAPSGEGMKVVGAVATIVNASFLRNASAGIWAAQGADVDLTDVVLDDTQAAAGGSGVGLDVVAAKLTGQRVTLSKSHGLGLSAALGAQVTIADLNISGTLAAAIAGRGVEASSGSTVELNRALITGSPDYALLVSGPDAQTAALLAQFPQSAPLPAQTTLNLYDLSVHDVGGGGLAALPGSTLELDTFDIRSAALVGLQLVEGATLSATTGKITSNPVGVNVQGGTTIDLTKVLKSDVVVTGNQVDRDTRELPVPTLSNVLSRAGL